MSKTFRSNSSQDLSAGALTHSVVIGTATPNVEGSYRVSRVALKAGSNISQVINVNVIPAAGSNYTVLQDTATLSSAQNYSFLPDGDIILRRGDTIQLTCANSGTPSITVYSMIELERID